MAMTPFVFGAKWCDWFGANCENGGENKMPRDMRTGQKQFAIDAERRQREESM